MNIGLNKIEHNGKTYNIRISYDFPPIPIRDLDYSAIDDDTYDGAEDSHCPIGTGATPEAALAELFEKIDEREN
jgi:hypothetical protein